MGKFKIINQSGGVESATVCTDFQILDPLCALDKTFTVKEGDRLSLYYDFGFDLQVPPNTKVHFILADQGVDAKISPAGADRMNNEGWLNPNLADVLLPGTFTIYAYDEYYKKGTTAIILTVEAPGSTCLKEGEFNFPYLGKACCPGLETGWDLKCKTSNGEPPATDIPAGYVFLTGNIYFKPKYRTSLGQGILMWDAQTSTGFTRYASDSGNLYALAVAKESGLTEGCVPTARKCVTPLNGKDTDGCTEHVNAACNPVGTKKYKCVSGTCKEDPTGTYVSHTCNGDCVPTADSGSETIVALIIAAGIAAAIILKKKEV